MKTKESLIFYTGQVPIREMLSSVDPAALGAGQFALLDNLNIARNKVTARWGCARIAAAPVAGASFRGCWSGYMFGLKMLLAAFRVSGATRIYRLITGSYTWIEITTVSTRFSNEGWCDFTVFFDPGFQDLSRGQKVYITNGISIPIVYDGFAVVIVDELFPNDLGLFATQATPPGWFNIKNGTITSYSSTNLTNISGTDTATSSTTINEISLTVNGAANNGDALTVDFGSGTSTYDDGGTNMRLDEAQQFHILIEDSISDPVFNYLEIGVAANVFAFTTIYDPLSSDVPKPIYTQAGPGVYLASFDLTPYNSDLSLLIDLVKFQLTVKRKLSATRTCKILAFMSGGLVDASSETCVSYMNSVSSVESARYVCRKYEGPSCGSVGGNNNRTTFLPQSFGLYFKNYIYYQNLSSSGGLDYAMFYRQDPVDERHYACLYEPIVSVATTTQRKIDNVRSDQKDYRRFSPSDFTVIPLQANSVLSANNRLFLGGVFQNRDAVFVSDENFPMRFSSIPHDSDGDGQIDADSGTNVHFPGEVIQRVVNLPGSLVGISPIAVITNRNTWRLEGIDSLSLSRPTLLSPHGTLYPRSVALQKGNLYFLDSERQPRMLAGGYDAQPLGIWKIEDQIQDGDATNIVGIVYRETYKLAYRAPSTSVNQRVLNFEERSGGWHRHSYVNPDWAGYMLEEVSLAEGTRLLGVTDSGEIFEVEQKGKLTDDRKTGSTTDDISITLITGELHGDLWESLYFGRVGLLCDKAPGRTLTVTRSDPAWASNDGTTSGVIDCEFNVSERAWRYDQTNDSAKRPPGIKAQSCQVTISGAWTPGKHLKGLFIEVGPATRRPDVAA